MSKEQFIAIGDIHGCLRSLEGLLEKLASYKKYTFIFIGDYIDRGSNSYGVVERLINFQQEEDCIFLRGNHEQMLLNAKYEEKLDLWLMNGGKSTIASYNGTYQDFNIPEEHLAFFEATRMYYDTENYFFVHAGLSPAKTIEQNLQNEDEVKKFLWERQHLNAFETPWEKTVVFGHTPRPHPIRKHQMLGIDTGCVYDSLGYGKLTAVVLPDEKFIQQVCLDH